MSTREGEVKKMTRAMLEELGMISASKAIEATANNTGWFFMPVSNGMGVTGIPDFLGEYKGRFFAIETKVPGKSPTALQQAQLSALYITGALEVVVHDLVDLTALRVRLLKGI